MKESNIAPEVVNYGASKKEEGYKLGYMRATYDSRKRRSLRQKTIHALFGDFFDYLDDMISENKKH